MAVAVIFGIVAVLLANKWLSTQVPEERIVVQDLAPMTKIVVAGQDLDIGSLLSEKNLLLVRGSVPGAVGSTVTIRKSKAAKIAAAN